jgi:MbtH protein
MGAAIAIAVAEALEGRGEVVDFVGLLDPPILSPAPDESRTRLRQYLEQFFCSSSNIGLTGFIPDPDPLQITAEKINSFLRFHESLTLLPEEERSNRLADHLIEEKLISASIPKDQITHVIRLLETHERLLASFQPKKIPDSLYIWQVGNETPPDPAKPVEHRSGFATWVSRKHSIARGNHWSMMAHPHVDSLANDMSFILADMAPYGSKSESKGKPLNISQSIIPDPQDDERIVYRIVVNQEEQFSVWPTNLSVPAGWREEGTVGAKGECLTRINRLWTDMRPLSLRKSMAAAPEST